MSKVIAAFLGAEVRQTGAEERPEGFGGSTAGGAHEGFELREAEFNGIEVRTVGRQIAERGADALDRLADAGHFVCAEVIGDDDVPGMQGGHEDLFDIGEEARPVDGAVEDPGRGQARHPQRGEKRTSLPPGARRVVVDAGPAEGPTIPPQEIVRNAGFIEKNQAVGLTRFRGHLTLVVEGVHDAKNQKTVSAGVSRTAGRVGPSRTYPEDLAGEFEPTAQSISNWVAQADRDAGRRTAGLTTAERTELTRLRRENRQLKVERDILSKAAAWFAQETAPNTKRSSGS